MGGGAKTLIVFQIEIFLYFYSLNSAISSPSSIACFLKFYFLSENINWESAARERNKYFPNHAEQPSHTKKEKKLSLSIHNGCDRESCGVK